MRRPLRRWCKKPELMVWTRKVDDLVQALGMNGISKSQVSALCKEIDGRVNSFLSRPIEGGGRTGGWMRPI